MLKKMVLLVSMAGLLCAAQAQQSLGDMASQAGVEWLAGDWQSADDGGSVSISFKPDLNNYVVFVTYKDQRADSKGMIFVDPASSQAKYCSANDQGGAGTGTWSAEKGKAILKYKHTEANGQVARMGITFSKTDSSTMEVKILDLNEKDQLGDEEKMTAKFKRKK